MSVAQETVAAETASAANYARKALAASAVGYAMDGFDFLILGFVMSAIARDLGLGATASASLATFTLIGAVIGGFVFGILADRHGRVRVLSLTILLFATFTGLSAFAQGYWDLVAYRTIAGLGLGGEFGIGMALVAEAWPASQRARASSYVGLGWQAGVLDRLARHVPRRPRAGFCILRHSPVRRRSRIVRAQEGEGLSGAPPRQGCGDGKNLTRHVH